MKASLRSVRIAPKKASLVAKLIRGMSVAEAQDTLTHTNKKAARIFQGLLNSAVANATHNENQSVDKLTIKSLIVNKAQAYHRGVPMARGRVRPMRKFLSHISLTLGVEGSKNPTTPKSPKSDSLDSSDSSDSSKSSKNTSQPAKKPVKKAATSKKSTSAKADTASSKGTSATKAETTAKASKSSTSTKADKSEKSTSTKSSSK